MFFAQYFSNVSQAAASDRAPVVTPNDIHTLFFSFSAVQLSGSPYFVVALSREVQRFLLSAASWTDVERESVSVSIQHFAL